ncbi:MAG: GNAT family N-acetyltransferase [Crocinitomicaceae bacterium]|nr:GNAT family N-acetyltransferase [Crocinitomicaceae bacterium]
MSEAPIIAPIDREILKKELSAERFVRTTRKGENEIYIVNQHNAPNVVQEIGRLREVTFRASGGGTGLPLDLDEYDTNEICYEQLIVWSPEDEEIIGGYRYMLCDDAIDQETGEIHLSTHHYFDFSDRFIKEYLPFTIELGRSWVQPNFQPSVNPRKGLFALDNIWDGLGAISKENPAMKYFFGKVTMYPSYNRESRDFLLHFMQHYFPDTEGLMETISPLIIESKPTDFPSLAGLNFKEGFKVLNSFVRERGEFVPPLVNIYMNLSDSMKTFGTAINKEFGAVEETGILVVIEDIYPEKVERHMRY